MTEPLLIAKSGNTKLAILPGMANRHGQDHYAAKSGRAVFACWSTGIHGG